MGLLSADRVVAGKLSIEHLMRFRSYVPAAPLRDFVHDFWLYQNYTPTSHARERILPSGTIELVINLKDNELRIYDVDRVRSVRRFSGALVSGAYGRSFVSDTAEEESILGVHFKAGGAFPFLGVPPDEIADKHLDLETLWGRAARELRERLFDARTPKERFHILEDALLDRRFRPLEQHYAVAATLDEFKRLGACPRTREMARRLGLSQRCYIRVFAGEVGLTPKLFGRIQRFHRALALVEDGNAAPDWSRLSLDCGYFDQAHLINDFVEFSGLTPNQYFRQLNDLQQRNIHRKRNHLPIAT